ncbi:MAG: mechanosensitive ion channel [Rhodobacteraceae bacterium]|uniref:mechanosensitive ion channel family protein n=1 Tax=Amaricoccus sp. B4 TaxID=3368557 RepID=UPI000DAE0106|nr:mechanosensitive ion channel [Paracoccaceae bacterium]
MESYQRLIDVIAIENFRMQVEYWLLTQVLVWSTLGQITATIACLCAAWILSKPIRSGLLRLFPGPLSNLSLAFVLSKAVSSITFPLIALAFLGAAMAAARTLGWPDILLGTAVNLLAAWVVIRLAALLIRNAFLSRLIAFTAFGVATLDIFHLLSPLIVYLDHVGIRLGSTRLTLLEIVRGAFQLIVLLWLALTVSRLIERRVQLARGLTPSLKVLTTKMIRLSLITTALVAALTGAGIDLTAFALFTGALGVGIGFGLQKPIANVISGLILLFDRSIKPGDVVELSDPDNRAVQLFGWVTALNARYVSLTTRDGTEWLVPNEDLITRRVINWSYNNNRLRLLTPIGVSFDCDVRHAMELAISAARNTPRVLQDPAPVCRLMSFADSTVNLELRFWIEDPTNGIINVRSEVLLAVWEQFRIHGIRTPLGHRDIYVKGGSELTVKLDPGTSAPAMA